MRSLGKLLLLLIGLAAACLAQTSKVELGLNYNWMYSNHPPGGDSTFSMNGGSASLAWSVSRSFAVVGDVGAVHAADVPTAGQSLTVTSYVVGPRFYYRRKSVRGEQRSFMPVPYGQLLLGGAHAGGTLSGSSGGSSNSFAMKVGGGFEMALNRRIALRLAQTEYLLTLFPNAVNSRQNNFLFGAGIVLRLH